MDVGSLSISVAASVPTSLLVYYGLRTLKLFKANAAARAWTYISLSAILFGVGVVLFLVDALQPMGLLAVGGIMQTVGAVLLVLGLRKNYLFWSSKDHFG